MEHFAQFQDFQTLNAPENVRIPNAKVPHARLLKPPYRGLGKLSSDELGIKLPEDELPAILDVGWDLLGIDLRPLVRTFYRSFGEPIGIHKSIILIHPRYLESQTRDDIPEYQRFKSKDETRDLIVPMMGQTSFIDFRNPTAFSPLFRPISAGDFDRYVQKDRMRYNYLSADATADFSWALAESTFTHGNTDVQHQVNGVAHFYFEKLLALEGNPSIWKNKDIHQRYAVLDRYGDVATRLASACGVSSDLRAVWKEWDESFGIFFWNRVDLYDDLQQLTEKNSEKGRLLAVMRPSELSFLTQYLFALTKTGEDQQFFTGEELETMILNLAHSESFAFEYDDEINRQRSISSGNTSRLLDAYANRIAPQIFALINHSLDPNKRFSSYMHRVAGQSTFSPYQIPLNSVKKYMDDTGEKKVVRTASKSNFSTIGKVIRGDIPGFETMCLKNGIEVPDKSLGHHQWTIASLKNLEILYSLLVSRDWCLENQDGAEDLQEYFDQVSAKCAQVKDIIRNTVIVPAPVLDNAVAEAIANAKKVKLRLVLDYHDESAHTKSHYLQDSDNIKRIAQQYGLQAETPTELVNAWYRRFHDKHPYAGFHTEYDAHVQINMSPKSVLEPESYEEYAVQTKILLQSQVSAADRSRERYKV